MKVKLGVVQGFVEIQGRVEVLLKNKGPSGVLV